MSVALVGSAGAVATAAAASLTPAFGQATTAGHTLIACVTAAGASAPSAFSVTGPSGWSLVSGTQNLNGTGRTEIWVKSNCGNTETAPTFNSTNATNMRAQLFEMSGAATTATFDGAGTVSSASQLATETMTATANTVRPGGYAFAAWGVRPSPSASGTWVPGSGWSNLGTDWGTSKVLHLAVDVLAGPTENAKASEASVTDGLIASAHLATGWIGSMCVLAPATATFSKTASDSPSAPTDALTGGGVAWTRTVADTLSAITDTVTSPLRVLVRSVTDALTALSDSLTRSSGFPRTASDTFGANVAPTVTRDALYTNVNAVPSFNLPMASSGGVLVMLVALNSGSVASIADDAGNTWQRKLSLTRGVSPFLVQEVWGTVTDPPLPITSVTVTLSATKAVLGHLFEVAGALASNPLDVSSTAFDAVQGTAVDSGTSAAPSLQELFFGAISTSVALTNPTFNPVTTQHLYAADQSNVPSQVVNLRIATMPSSVAEDFVGTLGSSSDWSALVFGIKPSAFSDTATRSLGFGRLLSTTVAALTESVTVPLRALARTINDNLSALPVTGFWFLKAATLTSQIDLSFTNAQTFLTANGLPWSVWRGFSVRTGMSSLWDGSSFLPTLWNYALAKARAQGIGLAVRVVNGVTTASTVTGNGSLIGASGQVLNASTSYTSIALNGTSAVAASAGAWIVIDYVPASGQNVATLAKLSADLHIGDASVSVTSVQPNTVPYAGLPASMDAAHTNLYLARGAFCYMDASAPTSAPQNARLVLPCWPDGSTNTVMTSQTAAMVTQIAAWCRSNAVYLLHLGWWGLGFSELANNLIIRQQPGNAYVVGGGGLLQAHKDLADAQINAAAPDANLGVELPMSGGGPIASNTQTPLQSDLSAYLAAKGNRYLYVQGNGVGPVTGANWTPPPYAIFGNATWVNELALQVGGLVAGLNHALQMIQPVNNYNWDYIFSPTPIAHTPGDPTPASDVGVAVKVNAAYIEIYDPELVGTGNTGAQLAGYMPGGAHPWSPTSSAVFSDSVGAPFRAYALTLATTLTNISDSLVRKAGHAPLIGDSLAVITSTVVRAPMHFGRAVATTLPPLFEFVIMPGVIKATAALWTVVSRSGSLVVRARDGLLRIFTR